MGQAKVENEDEEVIRMTHNGVGAVYAAAFASPNHSSRILKLSAEGGRAAEGGILLFTGGSDQSVHLWRVPDNSTSGPYGGFLPFPKKPVAVIDVPKSVNERMSYVNLNAEESMAVGDWTAKGGRYLASEAQEDNIDTSSLPALTVTAITVNNNGNEVAVGCSNGSVRVYDLGSGNGGKCTYVCDTKAAALGAYDDPDESMRTPPTIVSALSFEVRSTQGVGSGEQREERSDEAL